VVHHGIEAGVDVPVLAAANLVHGRLHVVVDAALWNAAQYAKGVVVGVEEHLVRLQQIGPDAERPAMAELEMRHLQLGALAGNHRPILAPVELERLPWPKYQRDERAAAGSFKRLLAFGAPFPVEGRHPPVRTFEPEGYQICVDLPQSAPLFPRFCCLDYQPGGQLLGVGIELA
jgi:hypothetical protein